MSESETNEAPKGPRSVMYVGPNIPARGLQQFTTYKDGVPPVCAGDAVLAPLFVTLEDFSAARTALAAVGSPLWCAYRDAAAAFSKRGA
jgi:hypothetical protein